MNLVSSIEKSVPLTHPMLRPVAIREGTALRHLVMIGLPRSNGGILWFSKTSVACLNRNEIDHDLGLAVGGVPAYEQA